MLKSIFKKKNRQWVTMFVDKFFFESQTDKYFLILKAVGKSKNESVSITLGNLYDENILGHFLTKNDGSRRVFDQLGIKVKKIRITKKVNSPDSAECTLRIGLLSRLIVVSTLDAIRLASEYNKPIEVPVDMLKPEKFDLAETAVQTKLENSVFASRFIERDPFNSNEVIM